MPPRCISPPLHFLGDKMLLIIRQGSCLRAAAATPGRPAAFPLTVQGHVASSLQGGAKAFVRTGNLRFMRCKGPGKRGCISVFNCVGPPCACMQRREAKQRRRRGGGCRGRGRPSGNGNRLLPPSLPASLALSLPLLLPPISPSPSPPLSSYSCVKSC